MSGEVFRKGQETYGIIFKYGRGGYNLADRTIKNRKLTELIDTWRMDKNEIGLLHADESSFFQEICLNF
jgi:hypothetical protein